MCVKITDRWVVWEESREQTCRVDMLVRKRRDRSSKWSSGCLTRSFQLNSSHEVDKPSLAIFRLIKQTRMRDRPKNDLISIGWRAQARVNVPTNPFSFKLLVSLTKYTSTAILFIGEVSRSRSFYRRNLRI